MLSLSTFAIKLYSFFKNTFSLTATNFCPVNVRKKEEKKLNVVGILSVSVTNTRMN